MRIATLSNIKSWLDRLAQQADLVAPRDVDGHVLYRPVSSAAEVLFEYERPELSAKDYLFPATEVLLRVEQEGKEVTIEEVLPQRPQVIFGLRPCDAHGLAAIDALFLNQQPQDRYYQQRRERTTLVGMACPKMWDGCFCVSVGGGPTDRSHLDVLLTPVEGGFAVDTVTPKGAGVLAGLEMTSVEGQPPAVEEYARPVPVASPDQWRARFKHDLWMRHGERCLSCRICTYVCPTCRCFDVTDRVVDVQAGRTRIERIRAWDACTSTNYRRAAGGHNSRPTKPDRIRNRFLCKFCYYPQDFGPLGCVGCGRCVVSCPVDIDITEIMREVAER